jgi:hypothetical protein
MDWGAVGAVAELLGAVGVIASLFYVASQIRRNSTALESATHQAVFDSTQQRLLAPTQNAEFAGALAKAHRGAADISPAERIQLTFFSRATFRGIQNAFFQHRQGLMSEVSWRDYDSIIRLNLQRSDAREWWPTERDGFDEEFATYVDKILAEEWPDS